MVSKHRGRKSNNRLSENLKKKALDLLRSKYQGFGLTLAYEKLFEGRDDPCVLLVFIDDATGKLLQLQFVDSESFFSYALAAEGYFKRYGKPAAFYSDKHSIFRVNPA